MRGRSLLKEPPGSSICAFCAHRLGAARYPTHVQRRFLRSSPSLREAPARGAALGEDKNEQKSPQYTRPAPSFGRPGGNGPAPTPNWGRPLFASGAAAQAGFGGNWGRQDQYNTTGQVQSSEVANNLESAPSSLLPHEQRARELMLERNKVETKREVNIKGGRPDDSRGGRPKPWTWTEADRSVMAKSAETKQKAIELDLQRRQKQQSGKGEYRIHPHPGRQHLMGEVPRRPSREPEMEGEVPRWSQLRRRQEAPAQEPPSQIRDSVAEGRAQREERARLAQYTPLGGASKHTPLESDTGYQRRPQRTSGSEDYYDSSRRIQTEDARPQRTDIRPSQDQRDARWDEARGRKMPRIDPQRDIRWDEARGGKVPRKEPQMVFRTVESYSRPRDIPEKSTEETAPPRQLEAIVDDDRKPRRRIQERDEDDDARRPRRRGQERDEDEDEDDARRGGQQRRKASRAPAGKPTYEAAPRGKDRDKARRRSQFAEGGEEGDDARAEALERAEARKQRRAEKAAQKAAAATPIFLPQYISISNLAVALKIRFEDFVQKLEQLGYEDLGHDYILNAEDAGLIAMEFNYEAIVERSETEDLKAQEPAKDLSILPPRPPVVTIMGHVDHGKTTLLDWLRKSSVAATEHGGITQHIGAFSVPMPSGKTITFLDTPGHAAFLNMRQRGANVTDIVILVVAADDSVKPQTIEAINHAKAAKVPIIVAINKIDKEETNVERVKQDLARHSVDVEDFGGDTQVVCVSGKTGQGMDQLEEAAVTLSEILDMRAETDGPSEGWVLEASIKSMGKVATVLVRRGTMRPGDFIVAGNTWARIRCLRNEAGVEIEEAGPGTPVQIDGWREQPVAGDEVLQAADEAKAKSVVDYRLDKEERERMAEDMEAVNVHRKAEQERRERDKEATRLAAEAKAADEEVAPGATETKPTGPKDIYFIVKGDVSGSVEAVIDSISPLGTKEVQPVILRSGVGQLSEFDIEHAATAKGHLINFNTTVEPHIARLAETNRVGILNHNVIYQLVDDVRAELSKHLPPLITQRVLGEAEVAQIFEIKIKSRKVKNIAGCKVRNGTVSRSAKVRVLRDNEKIFDGALSSLKNVKKDVLEMKKGSECGLGFQDWTDFKVGDLVQSYEEKQEKRYL